MADSDIRIFHFYQKYLWRAQDFTDFQTWLRDTIKAISEGGTGAALLSGLGVSPNAGMQVSIAAGIAVTATGQLMVVPSTETATFATPAGNPAKSLVVLRPKFTDTSLIPQPTNPAVMVPLHQQQQYQVVVLDGAPAVTPVYPTPQSEDVVLMGVNLASGQTTIVQENFDRTPINTRRKRMNGVGFYVNGVSNIDHDISEFDLTSGAATGLLPDAKTVPGETFLVMKTDSTASELAVSGAQPISGQTFITLEDQWQCARLYSNGIAWRIA